MNRRSFMASMLVAATAPYVVTSAGVLMPIRDLWKPSGALYIKLETHYHAGYSAVIRRISRDGHIWEDSPDPDPCDLTALAKALNPAHVHLELANDIYESIRI